MPDGKLIIPSNEWVSGNRVTIKCEIYNSACSAGTLSQTSFIKSTETLCKVDIAKWNRSTCLAASPAYSPDTCWCTQGSGGSVIYEFRLWVDPYFHNADWKCVATCTPSGGGAGKRLAIDNSAGVGRTVSGKL